MNPFDPRTPPLAKDQASYLVDQQVIGAECTLVLFSFLGSSPLGLVLFSEMLAHSLGVERIENKEGWGGGSHLYLGEPW